MMIVIMMMMMTMMMMMVMIMIMVIDDASLWLKTSTLWRAGTERQLPSS